MAQSTCHSCNKSQIFMERMMYCGFCGTHYTDTELHNASQRLKQETVVHKWRMGYLWGGIAALLLLSPLTQKVPLAGLFIFVILYYLFLTVPGGRSRAQELHPEKPSAE